MEKDLKDIIKEIKGKTTKKDNGEVDIKLNVKGNKKGDMKVSWEAHGGIGDILDALAYSIGTGINDMMNRANYDEEVKAHLVSAFTTKLLLASATTEKGVHYKDISREQYEDDEEEE